MRGTRIWIAARWLIIAAFLLVVARYYHPAYGFTAFIEFPANAHSYELPAVQAAPHYDHPSSGGYDGQMYAQLGVDPLVRNADLTRALDDPPYRARRILFSWIAYAFGLGQPAWILQVAALENVVYWLILAWLLWRWIPQTNPRAFVLWTGTLLAHGTLMSVRYALPDGLSALLIALAVFALERGRPLIAGALLGAAGLARETALLAAGMFAGLLRRPRRWRTLIGAGALAALPLALWMDYLRSIYRTSVLAGGDHITRPFLGLASEVRSIAAHLGDGFTAIVRDDVTALVAFAGAGLLDRVAAGSSPRRVAVDDGRERVPRARAGGAPRRLGRSAGRVHARGAAARDGRERPARARPARILVGDCAGESQRDPRGRVDAVIRVVTRGHRPPSA